MTDMISKSELEYEIAKERGALADTLASLVQGFKPNAIFEDLEDRAPELAQKAITTAKENPVAVAAIGAGLAMMAYTASQKTASGGTAWKINGEADATKVKIALAKHKVTQTAAQMRDALYDGTADLSDTARARIVAARQKAADAQARIEHMGRKSVATSQDAFQRNPLAICAGIAAAGAAIALSLPRTKTEDDTFGAHRDALVDQADAIFQQEMSRAMAQGREAIDAAQDALNGSGKARDSGGTGKHH